MPKQMRKVHTSKSIRKRQVPKSKKQVFEDGQSIKCPYCGDLRGAEELLYYKNEEIWRCSTCGLETPEHVYSISPIIQ